MNLALFIRGLFPENIGGQEIYGFLLLKNLVNLKNKITVYTVGTLKISKKLLKIYPFKKLNLPIFNFPFKVLKYVLLFIKNQTKLRIQLIHANGVISEGLAAILIKKILKIPVIITLHGGGIYNFGRKFPFIVKYILKHTDCIIAINNFLLMRAKQYTSKKINLIPNFIDSNKFKRVNKHLIKEFKEKNNLKDKLIILIVTRLVSTKGIGDLILAIREVVKRYPNICLIIIGDGPQKSKLIKFVNNIRIDDKIRFLGKISNEKLPLYYSACDLFVLPSLYEGQPTVILEAMACEAPVIATDVGGIKELIKSGLNGVLIPKNDYSTLKDSINELISNPELRIKMGKSGRRLIEEKFDSTKNFDRIYQLYIRIIKSFYQRR